MDLDTVTFGFGLQGTFGWLVFTTWTLDLLGFSRNWLGFSRNWFGFFQLDIGIM
jgi:hypothetical protein